MLRPHRAGLRIESRRPPDAGRPEGDGYVLRGSKRWITNGSIADVAVVWAREGDSLSGILVERVVTPAGPAAVVGVGVNVSQSPDELPVETAGSLCGLTATPVDRTARRIRWCSITTARGPMRPGK